MPLDMDMIRNIKKPGISGFSGVNISILYSLLFPRGYPYLISWPGAVSLTGMYIVIKVWDFKTTIRWYRLQNNNHNI